MSRINQKIEPIEEQNMLRVIHTVYFGYLVGQLREILEASIADERQLKALSSVIMDKMYDWWDNIGDKLTEKEWEEASKKHWDRLNAIEKIKKIK